ncbi:RpiB/LacA/LacB family sugar-phosphate isomerase [Frankia sp. CiP3]|uniref:RpiB/LacA/LacB family sugar-phosphate isomerase n=1 Tax=Frankia sp. CiP3 TaxID=2880971 RepID=UPI001EF47A69|nr:RpiB/LacA/LacB family sugar-phosphate isomerase [Frankia sp. CiP3]
MSTLRQSGRAGQPDQALRIAVGSDKVTTVAGLVVRYLDEAGHHVSYLPPPLPSGDGWTPQADGWVTVAVDVGEAVSNGHADIGVLLSFTGTGVSIAANKIPGVRAALCVDAVTAAAARRWNDANVCVLSYRLATSTTAAEILDAFLITEPEPATSVGVAALAALEASR